MAAAKPGPIPTKHQIQKSLPPSPPDWLNAVQLAAWQTLVANFLVTDQDAGLLIQYVRTLQFHEQAHQAIQQDGLIVTGYRGDAKPHPAYRVFRETQQMMSALLSSLVATPATRMKAVQAVAVVDPDDDLEID